MGWDHAAVSTGESRVCSFGVACRSYCFGLVLLGVTVLLSLFTFDYFWCSSPDTIPILLVLLVLELEQDSAVGQVLE